MVMGRSLMGVGYGLMVMGRSLMGVGYGLMVMGRGSDGHRLCV